MARLFFSFEIEVTLVALDDGFRASILKMRQGKLLEELAITEVACLLGKITKKHMLLLLHSFELGVATLIPALDDKVAAVLCMVIQHFASLYALRLTVGAFSEGLWAIVSPMVVAFLGRLDHLSALKWTNHRPIETVLKVILIAQCQHRHLFVALRTLASQVVHVVLYHTVELSILVALAVLGTRPLAAVLLGILIDASFAVGCVALIALHAVVNDSKAVGAVYFEATSIGVVNELCRFENGVHILLTYVHEVNQLSVEDCFLSFVHLMEFLIQIFDLLLQLVVIRIKLDALLICKQCDCPLSDRLLGLTLPKVPLGPVGLELDAHLSVINRLLVILHIQVAG